MLTQTQANKAQYNLLIVLKNLIKPYINNTITNKDNIDTIHGR
jgi:hypothetical protein